MITVIQPLITVSGKDDDGERADPTNHCNQVFKSLKSLMKLTVTRG